MLRQRALCALNSRPPRGAFNAPRPSPPTGLKRVFAAGRWAYCLKMGLLDFEGQCRDHVDEGGGGRFQLLPPVISLKLTNAFHALSLR